jgi:hypothetical protein
MWSLSSKPTCKKQDMKNKIWMKFFHELFMNMFIFLDEKCVMKN